jgi:hypothetical protein
MEPDSKSVHWKDVQNFTEADMFRQHKYSTLLAGVMGLGTLVLFHSGAEALDLSDFTGADQKVITQEAPKAGGVVLVKEDVVYPTQPSRVRTVVAQPVLTAPSRPAYSYSGGYAHANDLANIAPAAGSAYPNFRAGDGSTGQPGKGIDNKLDVTTMPGNSYDQAMAKLQPGAASAPVDGKPLTTTTAANGARINDLNDIAPAAGGPAYIRASVDSGPSVQSMTGSRQGTYNN